jgi:hypothetical protein
MHGVDKLPSLGRCLAAAITAGGDGRLGDGCIGLLPGRLDNLPQDVLALPPRRR